MGVSLRESWENHKKEGMQKNTASVSVCTFRRKALWLSACIAKLRNVVFHQREAQQGLTLRCLSRVR